MRYRHCSRCNQLHPEGQRCQRNTASRPELNTRAWQKLRTATRHRDHNQCTNCGTTTNLTVHHITPKRNGGTDTLDNLTTLCRNCHTEAEHAARRFFEPGRAHPPADFREKNTSGPESGVRIG